jgi:putative ABC transport system permease protein
VVAIESLHDAVARSYDETIALAAGRAALQVSNGEVGVPEALLAPIRATPGVAAAAASMQGFVALAGTSRERLWVFGVDLLADEALRDYGLAREAAALDDPIVFLAQPDSVALTDDLLVRRGLALGDRVTVTTPGRRAELVVRGRLDLRRGPGRLFAGRVALMDLYAAQRLFGLDGRVSQIDVVLAPGADLDAVAAALGAVVAGRGVVETPRRRGRALDRLLDANRYALELAGLLAVVVGLYLVFNTLVGAVAQRRHEIGVLRALGMRRRGVLGLVVADALGLATAGAVLGVPAGLLLAAGMSGAFAGYVGTLTFPVEAHVALRPGPAAWGIGLALASALLAAIVPARQAARVPPVEVLGCLRPAAGRPASYRRAALAGGLVVALALAAWPLRARLPLAPRPAATLVLLALVVGVSLVVPRAVVALARAGEVLATRRGAPLAMLAGRSVARRMARVAVTCAVFVVSLATAVSMATALGSIQHTFRRSLDAVLAHVDLLVTAAADPFDPESTPLPGTVAAGVAALPDVTHVSAVRVTRVAYAGSLTALVAVDTAAYADGVRTLHLLAGDPEAAVRALRAGAGAVVNEPFARRFGRRPGDRLVLAGLAGPVELPIVGIWADNAFGELGMVLVDRDLYRRRWGDDAVNRLDVVLRPGAAREPTMEAIRARFGQETPLGVLGMREFRHEVEDALARTFALAYPLVAIALAIALLGLVNALSASVLDRRREIGVLRAVGATRRQIVRLIVLESGTIGLVAGVLAVVVGLTLADYMIEVVFRELFGLTVVYRAAVATALGALVAAAALAAAAGWIPGRQAARLPLREALGAD